LIVRAAHRSQYSCLNVHGVVWVPRCVVHFSFADASSTAGFDVPCLLPDEGPGAVVIMADVPNHQQALIWVRNAKTGYSGCLGIIPPILRQGALKIPKNAIASATFVERRDRRALSFLS